MPRFVGLDRIDAHFACDLYGNARPLAAFRRNGFSLEHEDEEPVRTALSYFIDMDADAAFNQIALAESLVTRLSEEHAALVRAILVERRSLRRIAIDCGVTVQAISQRVSRLRRHLPELDEWWVERHRNRQRHGESAREK